MPVTWRENGLVGNDCAMSQGSGLNNLVRSLSGLLSCDPILTTQKNWEELCHWLPTPGALDLSFTHALTFFLILLSVFQEFLKRIPKDALCSGNSCTLYNSAPDKLWAWRWNPQQAAFRLWPYLIFPGIEPGTWQACLSYKKLYNFLLSQTITYIYAAREIALPIIGCSHHSIIVTYNGKFTQWTLSCWH